MRLINTETLILEYFDDIDVPKYAILSHRWGADEVSYQEYQRDTSKEKSGYRKILDFCKLAASRGLEWAWIDTCCIDKTSSAELTESINSMWTYYREAAECYAYLANVPDWRKGYPDLEGSHPVGRQCCGWLQGIDGRCFHQSVWFERGWTLQELLAPAQVWFCNLAWKILGTRAELAPQISNITGVETLYLTQPDCVRDASIAMRMSWASYRKTTRREDIAYCLLGLFDVNMPLLYGEGMKAFMRLQKKIIKKYDDESIFAWQDDQTVSGMLARSPSAFARSGRIVALDIPPQQRLQYHLTNRGLELRIPSSLRGTSNQSRMPVRDIRGRRPMEMEYPNSRASQRMNSRPRRPFYPSDDLDSDASEEDNSIAVGIRGRYAQSATQVPDDKDWKRLQLACGLSDQIKDAVVQDRAPHSNGEPNGVLEKHNSAADDFISMAANETKQIEWPCHDVHPLPAYARSPSEIVDNIPPALTRPAFIGITLSRTNRGWQRVNCEEFEWWPEFTKKDEFSRALYHVPQAGL